MKIYHQNIYTNYCVKIKTLMYNKYFKSFYTQHSLLINTLKIISIRLFDFTKLTFNLINI